MAYDPYSPRGISGKDAAGDQGEAPDDDAGADGGATDALVKDAADKLRNIIERVERLTDECGDIREDIKRVLAEGKGMGFDTKTIRRILKIRKQGTDVWREEQAVLETYMAALGMD